ncbi:MAG: hypothetical protein AAF721_22945 [Myxococcota bacterium]
MGIAVDAVRRSLQPAIRRGYGWLAVCVVTAACQRAPAGTSTGSASGAGSGSTGPATSTTFMDPDACMSSEDCETEGNCVAPYDPMPPDAEVGHGPASCAEPCIEENDLSKWCIDDAACCGLLRCNDVDGFCEPATTPTDGTSSSSGGSTGVVGSSSDGAASGSSSSDGTSTGGSTGSSSGSSSSGSATGSSGGSSTGSSGGASSGTASTSTG